VTLPSALAAWRRGLARYLGELRASQEFLAGEVSHGGWLDFGQFRWQNVTPAGRRGPPSAC
jgi:hypothetical protein